MTDRTLILITGPTGVGKTDLSLTLARGLDAPIVSCDSRQIYREIPIGTAAPSLAEQEGVSHFFIGSHSICDYYSAGVYEEQALGLLSSLFESHSTLLLCGGSMLYIKALCDGIDAIPDVDIEVRKSLIEEFQREGLDNILRQLKRVDPAYYAKVDPKNTQRVIHGLEVYLSTGSPLSSFHSHTSKERPFRILRFCLTRPREELYERIDRRVDEMLCLGLEEEARRVYPFRELNALQTVGYRELFEYFDGHIDREEAIRLVKRNSRHYARKQMTWFKQDGRYTFLDASQDATTLSRLIFSYLD